MKGIEKREKNKEKREHYDKGKPAEDIMDSKPSGQNEASRHEKNGNTRGNTFSLLLIFNSSEHYKCRMF